MWQTFRSQQYFVSVPIGNSVFHFRMGENINLFILFLLDSYVMN